MSSTGARAGTARGLGFGGEGDGRRATIATPPSRHYLNDDNYATDEIIFDDRRQPAPRGSPAPPTEPTPGARRPPKPTPWLGYLILAGCFAGFGYSLYLTPGILAPLAVNPLIGPTSDSLVKSGAKVVCLINGPQQQWWRLVSPMWLHGGVVHLGTNLNMLVQLGFDLERQAGPLKFAIIYIFSSIFSMVASSLLSPQSVTVGASGALFGLFGAYLAELITNCHLLSFRDGLCAFASLGFSIAINLAIGLLPFIDNFAHIGGFLGGLLMGFVLLLHSDKRGEVRCKQVTGAVLASATYVVLLGAGITGVYFDVNLIQYCPQCSYMSCVPSPWWSCDVTTSTKMYCNSTLS